MLSFGDREEAVNVSSHNQLIATSAMLQAAMKDDAMFAQLVSGLQARYEMGQALMSRLGMTACTSDFLNIPCQENK